MVAGGALRQVHPLGVYAVPAGEWQGKPVPGIGEWIMNKAAIPVADYAALAGRFNPTRFDAEAWADLAEKAGMKYLIITAKHHDRFTPDSRTPRRHGHLRPRPNGLPAMHR